MTELMSTLDYQDCGNVVHELSPAEAHRVAAHPENFVYFCVACGRERAAELAP